MDQWSSHFSGSSHSSIGRWPRNRINSATTFSTLPNIYLASPRKLTPSHIFWTTWWNQYDYLESILLLTRFQILGQVPKLWQNCRSSIILATKLVVQRYRRCWMAIRSVTYTPSIKVLTGFETSSREGKDCLTVAGWCLIPLSTASKWAIHSEKRL